MQIRDRENANAQVTDDVKDRIYSWLEENGVTDPRESIVLHHYLGGEYVAVSNHAEIDNSEWNPAYWSLVKEHEENRPVSDDTVWVHRNWIKEELF